MITVTLTEQEARSLANAGGTWADVLKDVASEFTGRAVDDPPPLVTGVHKLAVALACVGASA